MKRAFKWVGGAVATIALMALTAVPASAALLTVDSTITLGVLYQQNTNNPCIIGDSSCSAGPVGWPDETSISGNTAFADVDSPGYTVDYLQSLFGNALKVGLDVSQAGSTSQVLDSFEMLVNGIVIDGFTGPMNVDPTQNPGNGYADYLIQGFTSLASFQPGDIVTFRASMSVANDGPEQFFLASAEDIVVTPEPASTALFGLALVGAARRMRRRRIK